MSFKIEIEVSEENEGTDSPWWVIVDPKQNMKLDPEWTAEMITGPFFSRKEAEDHLRARRYAFSHRAIVYCKSGYHANQYKRKWNEEWTRVNLEKVGAG